MYISTLLYVDHHNFYCFDFMTYDYNLIGKVWSTILTTEFNVELMSKVYGRRAPWEDPTDWVLETYPWATAKDEDPALLRIRPEDVGYDTQGVITAGTSPQQMQKAKKTEMRQSGNGDPLVSDV